MNNHHRLRNSLHPWRRAAACTDLPRKKILWDRNPRVCCRPAHTYCSNIDSPIDKSIDPYSWVGKDSRHRSQRRSGCCHRHSVSSRWCTSRREDRERSRGQSDNRRLPYSPHQRHPLPVLSKRPAMWREASDRRDEGDAALADYTRRSRRLSPTRSVTLIASKYSASGMANLRELPTRSFHCVGVNSGVWVKRSSRRDRRKSIASRWK